MSNDFEITGTDTASSWDQRWMASNEGLALGKTGTLDLNSAGIAGKLNEGGVINPNGIIPAGVALSYNETTDRYELFDSTGAGDTAYRAVLAGFLLADIDVTLADNITVQKSKKAPISVLDRGDIKREFLPVVAQRTTLTYLTVSRGQFVFVN